MHIITSSEMQLRCSIWSLGEPGLVGTIKNPKHTLPKGFAFSTNGWFMAVAERKNHQDIVSIYYCGQDWKMVN